MGAGGRRGGAGGESARRAQPVARSHIVAVLERRGRLMTAVPLFGGSPANGRRERLTLAPGGGRRGRSGGVDARVGDLVLVRAAGRGSGPPAVVRRLGRPGVARDVLEALLLDRGLRRGFDPAVEREARAAAEALPADHDRAGVGEGRGAGRRDLRALPTFTIDPVSARDFDDAISAERLEEERVRVWVHIADVGAFVAPQSLVDQEAQRRGTSVYVPGTVEPMLPAPLSSEACSLLPGRERLAVTVELDVELGRGEVVRAAFFSSAIRSDERLDYDRADRIFAGVERAREPWAAPLDAARAAAAALGRTRARRGALLVETTEPEFSFDDDGHVVGARASEQTEAHALIEQLMVAANEQVAELLAARHAPALYRVHERPDPDALEQLVARLASLGVPTPPLPERISPQQAGELVVEISHSIDRHVRRVGHGRVALSTLLLRSLKQAYYSPRNLGHAGLGSSAYCHFTSPIRRYPDLVCHRALLSAIGAGEDAPAAAALAQLGEWTSAREREAMTIERDADDIAGCFLLERLLHGRGRDMQFEGEVVSVIAAGAFVAFGEPVEGWGAGSDGTGGGAARDAGGGATGPTAPVFSGMLPVRRMRGDWWELNEHETILEGAQSGASLRLGDPVRVVVRRVDAPRGRVDLDPA